MALRSAAELRLLVTSFREMAESGSDPWLKLSLMEVANDIDMEILAIDAAEHPPLDAASPSPAAEMFTHMIT